MSNSHRLSAYALHEIVFLAAHGRQWAIDFIEERFGSLECSTDVLAAQISKAIPDLMFVSAADAADLRNHFNL